MSIISRRTATAVLLVALVSGACGGGDSAKKAEPEGGKAGNAGKDTAVEVKVGGVYSPAAGLRADLTRLLQENVYLSGIGTELVLQGKDPAPVAPVLEANIAALGLTFAKVYDDAVVQGLVAFWRQKSALFTQFAQATAVNDQAAVTKIKADFDLYKAEFAKFVNAANPQMPADLLQEDAGTHINSFLSVVTAQSKKDPLALEKLKKAAEAMPRTGAVFAAGIVKQMPKEIEGSADGTGATLLATLTAALQEHVYLLASTTRTVVAGGDDKKLREVLDENSEGLANLIASLYGDPSGRKFLRLWRGHVGSFVEYAEAAVAKDVPGVQAAAAELSAFRTSLAALLESLNRNLPKQAVAADFEDYVAAVETVIIAQAAADPAEFQRLHETAATTPLLAEVLAGAIAKQFDTKFS